MKTYNIVIYNKLIYKIRIYFLCFICPPLALLLRGKIGSVILNILLCIFGWVPGIIHAILVISSQDRDKQNKKIIEAIKNSTK